MEIFILPGNLDDPMLGPLRAIKNMPPANDKIDDTIIQTLLLDGHDQNGVQAMDVSLFLETLQEKALTGEKEHALAHYNHNHCYSPVLIKLARATYTFVGNTISSSDISDEMVDSDQEYDE